MADDVTALEFSAERIVKSGKTVVTAHVNAKDDRWLFEFAQPQGDASVRRTVKADAYWCGTGRV